MVAGGEVRCWGAKYERAPNPTRVEGLTHVVQYGVGHAEDCARFDDGSVRCASDALSDRTAIRLRDAVDIQVGPRHSCAIRRDKGVSCWGWNRSCQIGLVGRREQVDVPYWVPGTRDIRAVALAFGGTFGLRADGVVLHWGAEAGCRPTVVQDLTPVRQMAGLSGGLCTLGLEGEIDCTNFFYNRSHVRAVLFL